MTREDITALRLALEQPAQQYSATSDHRLMENAQGELERIKLVQTGVGIGKPEQEPVAWNVIDPTGKIVATEMNSVRGWARIEGYKPTVEGLLGFHEQGWRVVPTTPPQRTWVGLTNDEVNNLAAGCHLGNSVQDAIYKAIAKLKEKNT